MKKVAKKSTFPKKSIKVFSNLAVSVDGKIAEAKNPSKPLGSPYDRRLMKLIRQKSDLVLFGASTLRAHPFPIKVKNNKSKYIMNGVITRSGDLDPEWSFWKDPEVIRFVFTTQKAFRRAAESAKDRAFVVVVGEDSADPHKILEALKKCGCQNLLIEGGGEIIRLFIEAGLLDEMYLTWTPWLVGGAQNPSLVGGGEALTQWQGLKIITAKRVKDELYFHLKVKPLKG